MADELWRASQVLATGTTIPGAPCCWDSSITYLCRTRSAYSAKCGFITTSDLSFWEEGMFQPPYRYFGDVSAAINVTWNYSVEPLTEGVDEINCNYEANYTLTASCADPCGTWAATLTGDVEACIGEKPLSLTASGGRGRGCLGDPAEQIPGGSGADTVITMGQVIIGRDVLPYQGDNSPEEPVVDLDVSVLASFVEDELCLKYVVSASGTDSVTGDPAVAMATASYVVAGEINFCDEWTTSRLQYAVETLLAGETWSEWGNDCCAEKEALGRLSSLGGQEVTDDAAYIEYISLTEMEVQFSYNAPCKGDVLVTYEVKTYTAGVEEPEIEFRTALNPIGPVLIEAPSVNGRVCIGTVSAELI